VSALAVWASDVQLQQVSNHTRAPLLLLHKAHPGPRPAAEQQVINWLEQQMQQGLPLKALVYDKYCTDWLIRSSPGKSPSQSTFVRAKRVMAGRVNSVNEEDSEEQQQQLVNLTPGFFAGACVTVNQLPPQQQQAVRSVMAANMKSLAQFTVSYDTAVVHVRLPEGPSALHVAGAITAAGSCWLYPEALPAIAGSQDASSEHYDTEHFLRVLRSLQVAVADGELYLSAPPEAAEAAISHVASLVAAVSTASTVTGTSCSTIGGQALGGGSSINSTTAAPRTAGGPAPGSSSSAAAGSHQSFLTHQAVTTRHFRTPGRGQGRSSAMQQVLASLSGPGDSSVKRPFLLLQDCASQHTSSISRRAMQLMQQTVWQIDRNDNPIEALWAPLKQAAQQQVKAGQGVPGGSCCIQQQHSPEIPLKDTQKPF
jgi:hypothetical protein